ncbi:MAG TPA: hypothetical protein VGG33_04175 [Polyangia bacterium]
MNRRGRSLASLSNGLIALSLVALVGCGEEEFNDEAYGAIDLAPYFFDGSTVAAPTAGLPREIVGTDGWNSGLRAQYYDFGLVSFTRKRSAAGATLAEPDTARANPMYFFYQKGTNRPLFSRPVYDNRTGTFHMRGGRDTLDPNPKAPDGLDARAYYGLPYSARARNTVKDPDRGNADDYQRPLIDVLHNNANYSGVWEVVAVSVDADYEPDSIKSVKTLLAAEKAGKVTIKRTDKAINCPVLDDRTWVVPSNMRFQKNGAGESFMEVQPRIELWFRTKLGSCFMSNGWETIGETLRDGDKLKDPRQVDGIRLRKSDELGIDTFDVIRYDVGVAPNVVRSVVVPVGKHYIPKAVVSRPVGSAVDVRYAGDDLQVARPRHFDYEPMGYSPLVWLHEITVPQDPPYTGGTFKDLSTADPQRVAARTGVFVKNFPVAGIATPCVSENGSECDGTPFGLSCNRFPNIDAATLDPPSGSNIADVTIDREGGPRCDVQKSDFGEYCAPGVSRCESHVEAGSDEDKILQGDKAKFAAAGPAFTMPAATVMGGKDVGYYKARGYHKSFVARGYACHPATGGYCYLRCDGTSSSAAGNPRDVFKKEDGSTFGTTAAENAAFDQRLSRDITSGKTTRPWKFNFDARCGGAGMLGYLCSSTRPARQRVCLRECTTRNTEAENNQICDYDLNDDKTPVQGDVQFGKNNGPVRSIKGQTCNNLQGATSCSWNPDFEPRGPTSTWPPQ